MNGASMKVHVRVITAGKLRRYANFRPIDYLWSPSLLLKNLFDGFKVIVGIVQSLWLLIRFRPDIVFAKGGFVCLPVGWAARLLRVPIVIHDSDARPGLTNKFLASFAAAIATGYPLENYPYDAAKSVYTGVPTKQGFEPVSTQEKVRLKATLGLLPDSQLIVAVGGGLGSRIINEALIGAVDSLVASNAQAVLIAGIKHYEAAQTAAEALGGTLDIRSFAKPAEMQLLLAAADIVVTRASATFLQELAGLEKPIIAIPARQLGDQHKNAELYRVAGAAVVLTDDQLEEGLLGPTISELVSDPARQEAMADRLGQFAKPEAAQKVAELIMSVVQTKA
jgi:UDP-N-acetylglucosamine--N-acetylmuramyl-(pentapeptide) pyrophosphoryl-undecaprenol N-acetylglucosamine transferase